jgi:hypothetical protein
MRCTIMNCLEPVYSDMAHICEKHRVARVAECKDIRSRPNYKPRNPDCTFGYHANPQPGETCKECHYCGQVHPIERAQVA